MTVTVTVTDQLRRLGFSDEAIARATVGGKPLIEAVRKPSRVDRMNKTEALYSVELEWQQREGTIRRWAFESLKFRLAKRTWYTPDFAVWLTDGRLRLVEVKGFLRDDAAAKFKIAREMYAEFEWLMVRRVKGHWEEVPI